MKKVLLLLLAIGFAAGAYAQTTVKGCVFEDKNKNGHKDGGEKGVAGVAVSNSVDVVLTDAKGFYELPVGDDDVIFVVKPAGYMPLLNQNNLPRFYYIHKPAGSPADLKYPGVAPTGPLPKSVDFALVKTVETDDFKFFVFGDPQPYSLRELEYFRRTIVADARQKQGVSFGISLGDISGDNPSFHAPYAEVMRAMEVPWYNVIGNHDRNYDAATDKAANDSYLANLGPTDYAFRYGKAHFIVLDNIYSLLPGSKYIGGFRDEQLKFVENYLKTVDKNALVFISFHIPLAHKDDAFRPEDRNRFFALLKEYPNAVALTAHTHIQCQLFYGKEQGWNGAKPFYEYNVGTPNGDWYSGELDGDGCPVSTMRDGTPKGYAVIDVKGDKFVADYCVAGFAADYQMEVYCPKVIADYPNTSASMYANFFMGAPDDKVEYRIDGGEWKAMKRVEEPDPSYAYLVQRWDFADTLMPGKRPSNPVECSHLWKAPVNTRLPLGVHQVEIRAYDLFGQEHNATTSYRIEKRQP